MVRDISEMTEDEIMDELNMKYGIDSMEIRNKLQPFTDFMVSWFDQFQKVMIEFWNSIPDEVKEAIAEFDADNPEEEDKIPVCPDCGADCQDGICWYCENKPGHPDTGWEPMEGEEE